MEIFRRSEFFVFFTILNRLEFAYIWNLLYVYINYNISYNELINLENFKEVTVWIIKSLQKKCYTL